MQLSIGVEKAGCRALDDESLALLTYHAWRGVDVSREEAGGQRWDVPEREGRHDAEVEFPVIHPGAWCDAGVVAVLARVGDHEGEGPQGFPANSVREGVFLRLPGPEGAGTRQQIAEETAAVRLIEAMGDLRFESDSRGTEKRVAVRQACINCLDASVVEDAQRVLHGPVQTEVPAEAVSRSGGNQAQRGLGSDEGGCDFVHRAISADCDHEFDAVRDGLGGKGRGVAHVLG